jgi:ABC-type transport system involved in Fe-S cluster assembly fused permease/ATPase subunit
LAIYGALLNINSSLFALWKFWLRMPLREHGYKGINTAVHRHAMRLSADFHEDEKGADLQQAMIQGDSVIRLFDMIFLQLGTLLIEVFIAFVYLCYLFGPYMALIMAYSVFLFTVATLKVVDRIRNLYRNYVRDWRAERTTCQSTLNNWYLASVS